MDDSQKDLTKAAWSVGSHNESRAEPPAALPSASAGGSSSERLGHGAGLVGSPCRFSWPEPGPALQPPLCRMSSSSWPMTSDMTPPMPLSFLSQDRVANVLKDHS